MNASTGQSADWPVQVSAISHWPADPRHTVFEPRKRHVLEQHSPFLHCAPAASLQVLASQQGSSHSCNSKPIKVILPGPSACNLRFGKGSDVCTHVCRWINACTRVCHRCRCMCLRVALTSGRPQSHISFPSRIPLPHCGGPTVLVGSL